MPRPCFCDRIHKGQPFDPARDCPHCWHWHHHEPYRRHHGGFDRHGLPCVHLGADTRETVQCQPCGGNVRIKLRGCSVHGTCTEQKPVEGYACCIGCSDRRPVEPVADVPVEGLQGHCFNGSIAEWRGKTYLCYRNNWSAATLSLVQLDARWRPLGTVARLSLGRLAEDAAAQEDPRLFVFGDRLHVGYSGCRWHNGQIVVSICYARLGENLQVEECFYPSLFNRQEWEKNWQFFEYCGQLYAVHTIQGQRVLRIGHRAEDAFAWGKNLPAEAFGELRGGASPVRVGSEFYAFLHGRAPFAPSGYYTIGLYTFSASPPFHPRRFVRVPLLHPDSARKPGPGAADVIFPGGVILRDGFWHVSYGSYDREIRVASWRAEEIEKCLEPVRGGR